MDEIEWPKIGLGTYHLHGKKCIQVISDALDIGYRLIDTAQSYENEFSIGEALKSSPVPREEIILCTKIATKNMNPMGMFRSIQVSLRKLGTEYIDVLMVHWPKPSVYNPKILFPALKDFMKHGFCKTIGVCNFTPSLLEQAISIYDTTIESNQIEVHAGFANEKILSINSSSNIQTIAHTPLGQGEIEYFSILQGLAKKYEKTVAQIGLAYVISKKAVPIPKTTKKNHLLDNFEAVDVKLSKSDVEEIDRIPQQRLVNPTFMNWDS